MPTYEYACKGCGEHLEIVQSFRDDPITTCPSCGGDLRKVFGSIGIAFRGPGFYRTDSRDTRHRKEAAKVDAPASASKPDAGTSGGSGDGDAKKDAASTPSTGSSSTSSSSPPKAAASS